MDVESLRSSKLIWSLNLVISCYMNLSRLGYNAAQKVTEIPTQHFAISELGRTPCIDLRYVSSLAFLYTANVNENYSVNNNKYSILAKNRLVGHLWE